MNTDQNNAEESANRQLTPAEHLDTKNSKGDPHSNEDITEQPTTEIEQGQPDTSRQLIPGSGEESNNDQREMLQSQNDENMEIHHPHHMHHAKSWKGYLYEFVMLFLAVTAGFFVENKREHYIEHKRAEQFSMRLLADLRSDSSLLEQRNKGIETVQRGCDKLIYTLTQKTSATDKEILETLLPATFVFDLPATTTTYNQMKTSGSLRYIENQDLTSSLQNYYDVLLPRCIKFTDLTLTYFSEKINPFYLAHFRIQDYDPFEDSLINKSPVIIERSSQTDQELANIMGGFRYFLKVQAVTMNYPALAKIKETIILIKKEYHLE